MKCVEYCGNWHLEMSTESLLWPKIPLSGDTLMFMMSGKLSYVVKNNCWKRNISWRQKRLGVGSSGHELLLGLRDKTVIFKVLYAKYLFGGGIKSIIYEIIHNNDVGNAREAS